MKKDEEFWEGVSEDPSTVCASLTDPAEVAASRWCTCLVAQLSSVGCRPVDLKLDECLISTVRSAALKLVKQVTRRPH